MSESMHVVKVGDSLVVDSQAVLRVVAIRGQKARLQVTFPSLEPLPPVTKTRHLDRFSSPTGSTP